MSLTYPELIDTRQDLDKLVAAFNQTVEYTGPFKGEEGDAIKRLTERDWEAKSGDGVWTMDENPLVQADIRTLKARMETWKADFLLPSLKYPLVEAITNLRSILTKSIDHWKSCPEDPNEDLIHVLARQQWIRKLERQLIELEVKSTKVEDYLSTDIFWKEKSKKFGGDCVARTEHLTSALKERRTCGSRPERSRPGSSRRPAQAIETGRTRGGPSRQRGDSGSGRGSVGNGSIWTGK